jgi:NAD+ synthase
MYAERGFVVVGTTNRTELETGFFLPFGDGMAHIEPIAHLYKTEVLRLAQLLGTAEQVLARPPSAGFWAGETDLDDLAYWLHYGRPLQRLPDPGRCEQKRIAMLCAELTFERLDTALALLGSGLGPDEIARGSGLSRETVVQLGELCRSAGLSKRRALRVGLRRHSTAENGAVPVTVY